MGLTSPGVGIHGTPQPQSIGYSLSHGCIRMRIPEAEWLFDHVRVGATVFIVPRSPRLYTGPVPVPLKLVLNLVAVGLVAALVALFAWQQVHNRHECDPVREDERRRAEVRARAARREGEALAGGAARQARDRQLLGDVVRAVQEGGRELEATWRRYRSQGLVVVGVDTDDFKGDVAGFASATGSRTRSCCAATRRASTSACPALPESFFVDRRGRVVWHIAGGINASDEFHASFEQGLHALLPRT